MSEERRSLILAELAKHTGRRVSKNPSQQKLNTMSLFSHKSLPILYNQAHHKYLDNVKFAWMPPNDEPSENKPVIMAAADESG